jgi:hypothetical protein
MGQENSDSDDDGGFLNSFMRPFNEFAREVSGYNKERESRYQERVVTDASNARKKLLMQEQEFMQLQDEAASSGAQAIRNTAQARSNTAAGRASVSAVMPKEERDFLGL